MLPVAGVEVVLRNLELNSLLIPRELAVEEWLRSNGLKDCISAFRENGITRDQPDELTEAELLEIGLTIGRRKIFLQARTRRGLGEPPPQHTAPGGEKRSPLSQFGIRGIPKAMRT
jgi:hypothetical protein